jgi:tetratricopeptide (TPR) repeat protein
MPERSVARACWLGAALVLAAGLSARDAGAMTADQIQTECDLGITLALSGYDARAESVFISLLSHSPRDPRALTNLGNVHLVRGEADLALAFYERAETLDSLDAGIVLNQAVALMLLSDQDAAAMRAHRGIEMAGGVREASSLLGLRRADLDALGRGTDRSAEKPRVAKDEIAALLGAAKQGIPADSTGGGGRSESQAQPKRPGQPAQSIRSAGTRASGESAVADFIYWKR